MARTYYRRCRVSLHTMRLLLVGLCWEPRSSPGTCIRTIYRHRINAEGFDPERLALMTKKVSRIECGRAHTVEVTGSTHDVLSEA